MCYSQSILIVRISTTLTEAVHHDLSQYLQLQSLSFPFLLFYFLLNRVSLKVNNERYPVFYVISNFNLLILTFCRLDVCDWIIKLLNFKSLELWNFNWSFKHNQKESSFYFDKFKFFSAGSLTKNATSWKRGCPWMHFYAN